MAQSVYPLVHKIDTTTALDTSDADALNGLERLFEVAERLNRHLEEITHLELEEGDI